MPPPALRTVARCVVLACLTSLCTAQLPLPADVGRLARLPPLDRGLEPAAARAETIAAGPFVSAERLARGYTVVVVGVNGDNLLSAGLAPGLAAGGYPGAIEVLDWTTGHWPLFVYHLRASKRHRLAAGEIARKVTDYQARYPGRAVNLVGYSAGAAVALQAVEGLPAGAGVDRVVLVAAAVSPLRDLRPALARTRVGMWSYYQPQDVVALWAGTLVAGTADGHHIVSAGAIGFWRPRSADPSQRLLYGKLIEQPFRPEMVVSGNLGGHFQCVSRTFVAEWIAPVLSSSPEDWAACPRRRN